VSSPTERPILEAILPGGASWSRVCRRGTALTLTDIEGGANVSALFFRASDPVERYCMPDTLKAQHVSRLTAGVALYSDMGRVLASVTEDTCGWHDTITGHATASVIAERWGAVSYHERRNDWRRSAREAFVVDDGELSYASGHSASGTHVTVRFELDTLVVLSSVPHPLDPAPEWSPRAVRLVIAGVPPVAADDPVRTACEENERGFAATEADLL
jgi:uncharacterized protein YcgI (DUF1989 family)